MLAMATMRRTPACARSGALLGWAALEALRWARRELARLHDAVYRDKYLVGGRV
jgi:hypothetical protein